MPVQGHRWPESKASTQSGQDALPSRRARAHTHTHAPAHTSLGRGKKLESPEKTHIDMERMYELHTDPVAPAGNRFFFFIDVITK